MLPWRLIFKLFIYVVAGSILMDVVASGNADMLDELLNSSTIDLQNTTKFNGQNALHLAANYGQCAILERLLQAGCNPNQKDNSGNTALHAACRGGHWEAVQFLLMCGADVNSANNQGQTPAHIAALNGELACLKMLDSAGKRFVNIAAQLLALYSAYRAF